MLSCKIQILELFIILSLQFYTNDYLTWLRNYFNKLFYDKRYELYY